MPGLLDVRVDGDGERLGEGVDVLRMAALAARPAEGDVLRSEGRSALERCGDGELPLRFKRWGEGEFVLPTLTGEEPPDRISLFLRSAAWTLLRRFCSCSRM